MIPLKVVVFGGGDWQSGTENWELGVRVGRFLAEHQAVIVTGGYGGAMEAVSEGAAEAGGKTSGVLHSPANVRPPNRYVQDIEIASDYLDRLARLLRIPRAVALPGGSGTLAEIAVAVAMLHRYPGRRLALWEPSWRQEIEPLLANRAGGDAGIIWFNDPDDLTQLFTVP